MDFSPSARCRELSERIAAFMRDEIAPVEARYAEQLTGDADWRRWRQPDVMETLKAKARAAGLWNLFLPEAEHGGAGLSNAEYAPLAELMGHSFIAPEAFNCNAPDTGNMEVLARYGSPEQRRRWLEPLLAGEIRSAFCMTEPEVASSDATNMRATAKLEGDEIVLNGRKWWSTGIGHPLARVVIFMGLTDPQAEPHRRHTMVLCPLDAPGVRIERMLPVFNAYDEPSGHGEVSFTNVRLPASNVILGPGRGFEIAQGRLGPGRIHHCMRALGAAEKALTLLCARATARTAFGKPLVKLGGNGDVVANLRMAIEQARLLTLKAAWTIDTQGVKAALSLISQIKVVVPAVAQQAADAAIQIHGGAGLSNDFPLAALYAYARVLRIADGPDEVHRAVVAKLEVKRQLAAAEAA
ncbi:MULTISPECIES: acyl-CoA dehydrogenase family protein [Burkholderia]|uniref:Acyl-CoA dehydrogenase domain protein n=12 Tax=pseudomallei group TaxID=111527 RepID=Q3JJZ8_BURP1|nr:MULTISPECIES: acyl-CoA dehydrogenase family protein [Burkholderia]EIF56933.1 acyl-CoA dehydrogenase domain-containing protein [Burkholderia pseudomallei 1258a]AAU45998.1 acyl-CoA dehydrogenase domain protein [Burkholderia mallei ATCC 23344]ABA52463.1 acyl-CoA dehydrogenase domain protein [Burkholderia pseudomallei 1710b]ABM49113.1 acyl-CoA dehydrogenase domain protein [Burkholderia mallei SAVP1]ABM98806.2 acyl-CoA dehydrogenase domain protein [Burkholderia mallei NCTC 10229]